MFPEAAVVDEPEVILPGGDGSGSATHSLEIGVRDAADLLYRAEHRGAHTVASGDVGCTALGPETGILAQFVAQGDGIEIVAAVGGGHHLHAGFELAQEPHVADVVQRDADDDGNVVVGAHAGKGAGRIAGTLDHQDVFVLLVQTGADGEGFRFLEGAGFHLGANLGPVAREGDIEILQAQELGKAFAFIGNGRMRVLEGPADG